MYFVTKKERKKVKSNWILMRAGPKYIENLVAGFGLQRFGNHWSKGQQRYNSFVVYFDQQMAFGAPGKSEGIG